MDVMATEMWLKRLNARLDGVDGGEAADIRDGVLTAYLPAEAVWRGRDFDDELMHDLRDAILRLRGDGLFGLSLEIGSGSIKLFARRWRDGEGQTVANLKLQTPAHHEGRVYVAALNRLIDLFGEGLRAIPPQDFDPAAPERLFQGFAAAEDFVCVYGTQAVRVLSRAHGGEALARVRVLDGDEEGLIAFESIVPSEAKTRPGTVAVEIGSGSTEIVRVDPDGRAHPVTLAIGGKTDDPPLKALERFLARSRTGHKIGRLLESPPAVAEAFFAAAASPDALYINASRASAKFRAFARDFHPGAGDDVRIDDRLAEAYVREYGADKFAAKVLILLAVARGLGFGGYREGTRGGLKMGVAALLAKGLRRFGV